MGNASNNYLIVGLLGVGVVVGIMALMLVFNSGGVGGLSFVTMDTPNGTDPEASPADTLVFAEGVGITITGDATTDTITIASSGGVTLVDDPGGTSVTTGSESGLEIIGGTALSMLRGCANGEIEKWNSTVEAWLCSADSTGGSPTFDAIASGTNITAAMIVGDGAEVRVSMGGHVESTQTLNPIHNSTGATLYKCTAVYVNGFSVPDDLATAGIADADATNPAMGIIHDDIADGADGYAVVVGGIDGLDTTNAESWAVGDVLYLNTGGTSTDDECGNTLTNIRPTGSSTEIEKMAIVERVHATNGSLKIIAKGAYADVPNLVDDGIRIGDGIGVPTITLIPDCDDTGGNHLNYDTTGNALTCGNTTSGAGAANSFETISTPAGTSPVADSSADTLTLTSTGSSITITGDSGTDTINMDAVNVLCTGCINTTKILDGTINFPDIEYTFTPGGNPGLGVNDQFFGGAGIIFEGPANDTFEGELSALVATSDKSWVLPNVSGTIITTGDTGTVTGTMILDDTITFVDAAHTLTLAGNPALGTGEQYFGATGILFEGTTADTIEGLLTAPTITSTDKTWTLPDVSGTIVTTGHTGIVTSAMVLDDQLQSVDMDNSITLAGNPTLGANNQFFGAVGLIFEGPGSDAIEGMLEAPTLATSDKTWTLPNATGNVVVNGAITTAVDGRSLTVSAGTLNADAELYTDTRTLWIETPTAADDFQTIWAAVSNSYTMVSITCETSAGGTVNFDLQIDDGTPAGVNGSDIACTTFATDAVLSGDVGLDVGERLDLAITSVSGSPTFVSISWTATKND